MQIYVIYLSLVKPSRKIFHLLCRPERSIVAPPARGPRLAVVLSAAEGPDFLAAWPAPDFPECCAIGPRSSLRCGGWGLSAAAFGEIK